MKKYITVLLAAVICFTSCYKDKGNYDYNEPAAIKIEGIPEKIQVIRKRDRIVVTPKITSSKEGEIKGDNPNFTFRYRLGYKGSGFLGGEVDGKGQPWIELTPTNGFNLDIPTDFEEGNYICWFTITDKRNNVVHSQTFDIQVATLTFQGWMVLSNMGQEERVRLDMISHALATPEVVYDIAEGLPELHHGTQLSFIPNQSFGDEIALFSKEGSYILNNSSLESDPNNEFNRSTFYAPPADIMLYARSFNNSFNATTHTAPTFSFVISDAGNVYARRPTFGEVFASRANTTNTGDPQQYFKVAPFVGFSERKPGNSNAAIFYDKDNKRFMLGNALVSVTKLSTIPIPAGSPNLFSYQTGKDMVYMEGSPRSNGMVNAILQDDQGKRSIYAMKVSSGSTVVQDFYHENVTAPGFEQATLFAFDPQFPFLFYAVGDNVYRYVLTTKTATEVANIKGGEITTLKYNIWRNPSLANLNNQSPEFLNQQYYLIVGTFDPLVVNGNGGKVTFYEVDGITSNVNKLHEYGGFGKVKDVVYRERVK